MPSLIDLLIEAVGLKIGAATEALAADLSTVALWHTTLETILTRYHLAAMMAGVGRNTLTPAETLKVTGIVQEQLKFLDKFAIEIQDASEFEAGWAARAQMYGEAIQVPYWSGRTKMLPLPAMPGDGTSECLSRCRCSWEVTTVDEANGDYNATWHLGASTKNCQQCIQRSRDWAPLEIRNGVLA